MRLDLANGRKAEYLEAAAVGKDRRGPIDKRMQTAGSANDVHARPDAEVVSVAEDDLRAHFSQFTRVKRFDTSLCADRHEHGGVDHSMSGRQPAKPGFAGTINLQQLEHSGEG